MSTPAPLLVAAFAVLAACVAADDGADDLDRRRKADARPVATAVDAAPAGDAAAASGSGVVACYTEGAPATTCAAPDHCCFSNYNAHRNGYCTETACAYGTITCDGPEDCAPGDVCCATAIRDPENGTIGYMAACRSTACGGPPLDHELCHAETGCSDGKSCVTAYGNATDLPRALSVCL